MNATRHAPSVEPSEGTPQGILIGVGVAAVVGAAVVASAIPGHFPDLRYAMLVLTVLMFAASIDVWGATVAVAGLGYLVFDGFIVNQLGTLSWDGRADVGRLVALTAAVVCGRLISDSARLYRLFAQAARDRRQMRADLDRRLAMSTLIPPSR